MASAAPAKVQRPTPIGNGQSSISAGKRADRQKGYTPNRRRYPQAKLEPANLLVAPSTVANASSNEPEGDAVPKQEKSKGKGTKTNGRPKPRSNLKIRRGAQDDLESNEPPIELDTKGLEVLPSGRI